MRRGEMEVADCAPAPQTKRVKTTQWVLHLVDQEVLPPASQVVGQVAVLAELDNNHQRAC